MTKAYEINFDGLVGPTHNYSGLSYGNIASITHQKRVSNPRQAALQGLEKMKFLFDLGIKQAIIPPQQRPDVMTLRSLGFTGSDARVLRKAFKGTPQIFFACCSASSMWTANAATVTPSVDTADCRVHFTPANLIGKFHRSLESKTTARILKSIFKNGKYFAHHDPLPPVSFFGDEGAANHTRFCESVEKPGLHLFVYGREAFHEKSRAPIRFPARQTYESGAALARLHQLNPHHVCFAQQSPEAIDAGAFHNDVVAVGHENLFFYHEKAFLHEKKVLKELKTKFKKISLKELQFIRVSSKQVSLKDAVFSYLFNTQLVTLPTGKMALIAPIECQEISSVKTYLDRLVEEESNPIHVVHTFNLRQSMQNGGGPACLRLRVVLTEPEIKEALSHVFLSPTLYKTLCAWVKKHYRDKLLPKDLVDPKLISEVNSALDELTQILKLGSIYPFQ